MNGFEISKVAAFLLLLGAAGCADEPPLRPMSPQAQLVRVESFDPPAGADLAGAIQASDGEGCGIGGTRGSLANATAALKEAAARRGAGFVKLTRVTRPYSGRDCYHVDYVLEGMAYYLNGAPAPVLPAAPAVPTAPVVPAGPIAPVTTSTAGECSPPCSPGYACSSGVCLALCNPACSAQEMCRADRVCVPAATP
jgi:hypothetical protein